jgi:hypothetical protein
LKGSNVKQDTKTSSIPKIENFPDIIDELLLIAEEMSKDLPQEASKIRQLAEQLAEAVKQELDSWDPDGLTH